VLDFAKCLLDEKPQFSAEQIERWCEELEEWFGERWRVARMIHWKLFDEYGIYYTDLKPGNIAFAADV